jgi:hypothetical protein
MGVAKSEVVSVRVLPHIKTALQAAATSEMRSVANMVEVMVVAYCQAKGMDVLPKIHSATPGSTVTKTAAK